MSTGKLQLRMVALALALALACAMARRAPAVIAAGGTTFTVCASGCDFSSIQTALDDERITTGDTILVVDGMHTEAGISVHKDVIIQG